MIGTCLLLASVSALAGSNAAPIVLLGDAITRDHARAYEEAPQEAPRGALLTSGQALKQLTGSSTTELPSEDELAQWLRQARDREAEFETDAANELRERVVARVAEAFRATPKMRELAAQALHDKVAILLAEDRSAEAQEAATRAAQNFPEVDCAPRLQNTPAAALLAGARHAARERLVRVTIELDEQAEVFVDGRCFGPVRSRKSFELSPGAHRFWAASESGASLPVTAVVGRKGATTVSLTPGLDRRLAWQAPIRLQCSHSCVDDLVVLGRRLDSGRILGLRARAGSDALEIVDVDVRSGKAVYHTWAPLRAAPQQPTIAIIPPASSNPGDAWVGTVLADLISTKLLGHVIGASDPKEDPPLGVFTWLHVAEASRAAGIELLRSVGRQEVRRVMQELGSVYAFSSSYALRGDMVELNWTIDGAPEPHQGVERFTTAELGTVASRLTQAVGAAIGRDTSKLLGHGVEDAPQAAMRAYGEGLGILARQSLNVKSSKGLSLEDLARADALFSETIAAAPDFIRAWVGRAVVVALQGRQKEAEKAFVELLTRGVELKPFPALAFYFVYVQGGQIDAGIDALVQTVKGHPGFMMGLEYLAMAYLDNGRRDLARDAVDSYLAISPGNRRAKEMAALIAK